MTTPAKNSTANRIAKDCLAVRARLISRKITSIYDEAIRPLGMTAGQLNILVVVAKLGPISPTDIARRLHMEKSTLSRNVERMRRHGWIATAPSDSGRGQILSVPAKGRRQLEKALPLWKRAQAHSRSILGQAGYRSLHSIADRVWANLDQK